MKLRKNIYILTLIVCSVSATYFVPLSFAQQSVQPAPTPTVAFNDYQIGPTLYMQKAAEYRALAYQAFNLARWQLDADLDKKNVKKLPKDQRKRPRAIVVDIDETVLDNSPAQARGIATQAPFSSKGWTAWVEMEKAKPIPGAVDFLNYAVSKGVKIYYVSNRDQNHKAATIKNLTTAGFVDVSAENVLLREVDAAGNKISTKTPRRAFVDQKYRTIMLLGDNLDDFSDVFESISVEARFLQTDKFKTDWGKRWIVLPNAMYGTWENTIYEHKHTKMSETEKRDKRAASLELP